jgi:predicted short-subunit dehydrogenase-like oxidoreductase (DUF2520 family)
MKIVIVGSGNTATVLSALLHNAQHEIVQVVSRNIDNARMLASDYNASAAILTDEQFADADIYLIALNDAALDHVERIPALANKFVVHTAGAVSIEALKSCSENYGVLYPVQTLSKFSDHTPKIPFLVTGSNKETLHRILGLAKSISDDVTEANDAERLNYHVAAVFVSNFANHMFALAELFCTKEKIDFKRLYPLINEINERVNHHSPYLTQTGPAIRDDVFTLGKHLQALSAHPDLKYIYLKMSESIIKMHGKR